MSDGEFWLMGSFCTVVIVITTVWWVHPRSKETNMPLQQTITFDVRPSKGWPNTLSKTSGILNRGEGGLHQGWFHVGKTDYLPELGRKIWIECTLGNFEAEVVLLQVVGDYYSVTFVEVIPPEPAKVEEASEEAEGEKKCLMPNYGKNRFIITQVARDATNLPEDFDEDIDRWMADKDYYLFVPYGWKIDKIELSDIPNETT